jgi:threonylcarbamoyladenosine tRNA methylthiotransferase MtaB
MGTRGIPADLSTLDLVANYWVKSFGCRASAADGDGIALALEREGALAAAPGWETASLVVLNTCAVTQEAERDARAMVRRVQRRNPEAKIVITGCYAQRAPAELAALDGVDAVVGNSHKSLAAQAGLAALGLDPRNPTRHGWVAAAALAASGSGREGLHGTGAAIVHAPFATGSIAGEHAEEFALPPAGAEARTRPVLKIQEGCGNRCSFCVIPETRGPSRSVHAEHVLAAVRDHVQAGVQELVLSGINLGRWGRDLREPDSLPRLVRSILEKTALPRLRLSSIEPMDWGGELLGLFGEYARGDTPRLAPHAHLPLQSGSDTILRRMHRRYRPWHYAQKLAALRALLPQAAIGADVMVGFPGETEAHFRESFDFIEAQPFTYLHLFPYSSRPGTAAEPLAPAGASGSRSRARAHAGTGDSGPQEASGLCVELPGAGTSGSQPPRRHRTHGELPVCAHAPACAGQSFASGPGRISSSRHIDRY